MITNIPVNIQIAVNKIKVKGSSIMTKNNGPVKNLRTDSNDFIREICAEIEAPSV